MRPTIIGPPACAAGGPPPQFHVDTAGLLLFMVELAGSPDLMVDLTGRTQDNYFFGGETDNVFATGTCWRVPVAVWHLLRRSEFVYYRVIAVDQVSGTSRPSVEDDHLDQLPAIRVAPTPTVTVYERADRQE